MSDSGTEKSLPAERGIERAAGRRIIPVVRRSLTEHPVGGKTYSLYGEWQTTDEYYRRVGLLADHCQERWGKPGDVLARVRRAIGRRRLRRLRERTPGDAFLMHALPLARELLSVFTAATPEHLNALSVRERWDHTLSTARDEYHLLMLEIELTNRIHGQAFRLASSRLAFLPHCLRDWTRDCRSSVEGHDYVCRGCSRACWVNGVSKLLRVNEVTPHIWMTANLSRLFRRMTRSGRSIGVLGVACIPELARGMRLCMRHGVPVTGVPLNANRCARWTGRFQPTSVNLEEVARHIVREQERRGTLPGPA
jgi:hypothetical protein